MYCSLGSVHFKWAEYYVCIWLCKDLLVEHYFSLSLSCRTQPFCRVRYSSPWSAWCFTSTLWRWTTSPWWSSAPWASSCPPATPQAARPPRSSRWARSRTSSSTKLFTWWVRTCVPPHRVCANSYVHIIVSYSILKLASSCFYKKSALMCNVFIYFSNKSSTFCVCCWKTHQNRTECRVSCRCFR